MCPNELDPNSRIFTIDLDMLRYERKRFATVRTDLVRTKISVSGISCLLGF